MSGEDFLFARARPISAPRVDAASAAARFAAAAPADVAYATLDSPLGTLVAARTQRGLAALMYEDLHGGLEHVLDRLSASLSPSILQAPARLDDVRRELDEYFEGRRRTFDLDLDLSLARPFAQLVLEATARIPFGATRSYGEIAADAGSPRGARATGAALGANPIPIVVPCHRVLARDGTLHGYTGGLERKRLLLALEGVLPGEL
jgi:methylated-DNA-[protein]-cysteine S-methyltransferase